jgi:DNA-binding XRE family transcriptional regulator
MAAKPGSKYYPLFRYLQADPADQVTLTFEQIEGLLDAPLPHSAHSGTAFWSNRGQGGYQASAWMEAGYYVADVDLSQQRVAFRRVRTTYRVDKASEGVRWNSRMVRDLRVRLGINQSELADIVGVRQQTVSEWENGIYKPASTKAKALTRIAERAGFTFRTEESDP